MKWILILLFAAIGVFANTHWDALPWHSGFTKYGTKEPADTETRFKYYYENGKLHFLIEAMEPNLQRMSEVSADALWRNDSVEIAVVPDPQVMWFYKFIVDCRGRHVDFLMRDDNTDHRRFNVFDDWNGFAEVQHKRTHRSWITELTIPLGPMDLSRAEAKDFRINVGRNRFAGGETEHSSWSPLSIPRHVAPHDFRKVSLDGFQRAAHFVTAEKLDFVYRKNSSGVLELTVNALLAGETKAMRFVDVVFSAGDKTVKRTVQVRGRFSVPVSAVITDVKPGSCTLALKLYSRSKKPLLQDAVARRVTLAYSPVTIDLINPAYRDNIYATMPDKRLVAAIRLGEAVGTPLHITLAGPGNFKKEQHIAAAKAVNQVVFDLANTADGTYKLTVAGNGFQSSRSIRKLPHRKGEVWLDAKGVTYIDGKKTLPWGWYGNQPENPDPSLNWLVVMTRFADLKGAERAIAETMKTGQRLSFYVTQEMPGKSWAPYVLFAEKERRQGLSPAQRKKLIEVVSAISKSEGFFAWYMADEPEGRDNNPRFYEEALEIIKEHDPYHPGIMLNYGLEGIRKFYKGADILMPDCYPKYWEDGSTEKPRTCTSEWIKTASALRPAWLCAQMTLWPRWEPVKKLRGIAPDYRDQRMQFLQAFIHNAKGINMYTYYYGQIYSSLIIGHVESGQTVQLLKDYLLEHTVPGGVRVTPETEAFQSGLKKLGNGYCLIAVNTGTQPFKAEMQLKWMNNATLYEVGGKRVLQVRNGRCSDHFEAKESKVYVTDQALAAKAPLVADVERRIAEHRAGRLKNGNRIGTGEIYEADYRNYAEGRIPAKTVRIKASSDATFHATKQTGSLYHLVDGLTEPTRIEFTWSPRPSDNAPYLEFKLHEKAPLKEVKLYAYKQKLTTGNVIVNGKRISFDATGKKMVSIPLDGSKSDVVRIEFTPPKGSVRLLSEVEIY